MNVDDRVFDALAAELALAQPLWPAQETDKRLPMAAVLVALSEASVPEVLLGRRGRHLSVHPGEVAFPGGKREPEDDSPWETALRESWEEVGLPSQHVHPLAELPPLVTVTGFEVHPCIARVSVEDLALVVDPREFDSVFWQPLRTFAQPELFQLREMENQGRTYKVPHFEVGNDTIWGVTAAILALLANVAYDAGFDLQRNWKVTP